MITSYYSLPFSADKIITKKDANQATLKQSIVSFIHLIATTHFGECTFDPMFGCSIWNVDFDNLASTNKLRDTISESLLESIIAQEKRLRKVVIEVVIKQEEFKGEKNFNRIKKRVDIRVKGVISQTNEPFLCIEQFYIAPLSY